ncbi:ABC transporter permease subunit [Mycoplasma sp. 744]|uniref:ABC transporter permease n=1 Tax=Mycoplasma sp. 744 TaxID=3108531 RepID=UPI002B1DEDFB|nr:ABC transporter permease [Mycoplasma sp. 744]MEA4115596.1 ABC transporter permease subunit [Mycoplasma sp. 744]
MNKFLVFLKHSYIYLILTLTYIPLIFAVIFSFNAPSSKGYLSFSWNRFTTQAWRDFWLSGRDLALVNSIIIALITAFLVVSISLVTSFALWKQKNKKISSAINSVNNIPLINPDNITAIGLVLVFSMLFGSLANTSEGIIRGITGHTIMALPYGITLMLPRSEKFNKSLFEASQDLGFSPLRSWFKTYFVYMLPTIIFVAVVAAVLSFDDFIILRTLTNTSTLGTKLYESDFQAWGLVIGAALMLITLFINIVWIFIKSRQLNTKKSQKLLFLFKKNKKFLGKEQNV